MRQKQVFFRRDFLKFFSNTLFGLAGLLGLSGLVRFLSYQPGVNPPTEFNLGDVMNFPPGSYTFRFDIPAVIGNRAGQFIAYSLVCTHLGCTLEQDGVSLTCPCHGSRFTQDGDLLRGPAPRGLKKLHIELQDDNTLMLFTGGRS